MREFLRSVRVPGVAWIALILAVIGWLQGDYFADQTWVPGVVLILTVVVKLLQMYAFADEYTVTDNARAEAKGGYAEPWFGWFRMFWG